MATTLPEPLDEFLDAWNAWDVERMLRLAHPEIDIRGLRAALEDTSYHGRDGARRFFRDFEESWTGTHGEVRGYEEFGDRVAVTLRLRLCARASKVELEQTFGLLFEIDRGLLRAFITYFDPSEAYEAAAAGYPRPA